MIKNLINLYSYYLEKKYNELLDYFKIKFENEYSNPQKRFLNYDTIIFFIADKILKKYNIKLEKTKISPNTNILILCTEIYDSGGHTELILRFSEAFKSCFRMSVLLTALDRSMNKSAPVKSPILKNINPNIVELPINANYEEKITTALNYILKENITTIIVMMHMYDVVSCAVLGLIKKYTDINIFFVTIGDQYFTLGINHSDTILTRIKNGKIICPHIKNKKNAVDIPILEATNEINIYSQQKINEEKEKLSIPLENFVTLTGVLAFKILADPEQPYLKLIKNLLIKNPNMTHILLTKLNQNEEKIVKDILGEYFDRVKIIYFVPNFDFYIQLSDLYIDSFPQGSALTLIDYIKHSKPVVVKIDEKIPIRSFEDYVNKSYEYACKTPEEMYQKICKLIDDKEEYQKLQKKVREYYLENYDINKVKEKYLKFIK